MRFVTVALSAGLTLFPILALSAEISLGYISFDQLILGSDGNPGTNGFTIGNLTGDPNNGGNDLPPTWPVITSVTFLNSSLELVLADCSQNCSQTYDLGDITPQFFQSPDVQFPDTTDFASASFSATLDTANFDLDASDGGGTFTAATDQISALLLPSSGDSLIAGTDNVLITVSDEVSNATPEPSSFVLLLALGIPVIYRCWWRRRA